MARDLDLLPGHLRTRAETLRTRAKPGERVLVASDFAAAFLRQAAAGV